jgi:beta-N-acetylglucosaminidase
MKKLVIINSILLLLIYIIPTRETIPKEQPTIETEEIIENKTNLVEVTSRSSEQHKPIERIVNLELTVDSDLRKLSNLKAEEYNKMLEGTNLYGLGSALEKAEQGYSVNGLYLMGLACLESAYRYI